MTETPAPVDQPVAQPQTSRVAAAHEWRKDLIQIGFVVAFTIAAFVSSDNILRGVFVSLVAAIMLYYFLESLAKIEKPGISVSGAAAIFFITLWFSVNHWSKDLQGQIEEWKGKHTTLAEEHRSLGGKVGELSTQLGDSQSRILTLEASLGSRDDELRDLVSRNETLEARVNKLAASVTITGQIVHEDESALERLEVGLIHTNGEVFPNEGEQVATYRIEDVPLSADYRLYIYDRERKQYKRIFRTVDDINVAAERRVVNFDLRVRQ